MLCCDDINFTKPRRYIQYNDLVFSGRKSVQTQTESITVRSSKTARTFGHGSYSTNIGTKSYVDNNSISLQLAIKTNDWSQENVQVHRDFIMDELLTPGKLWAIDTGLQLIYCNAKVTSIQLTKDWVATDDGYLVFDVQFDNPDGIWYKANEHNIFLEEYSLCDFTDVKASCVEQYRNRLCCTYEIFCPDACECCESSCCDLDDMIDYCTAQENQAFCKDFFELCDSKWRVVYNCAKGRQGKKLNEMYDQAVCKVCTTDILTGQFYSDTTLDTKQWNIAILGHFKDPIITINGVDMTLEGEYNGVITINYKGEIHYAQDWECIEYNYKVIPLSNLDICRDTFTIHRGMNTFSVYNLLGDSACFYATYERITI